MLIKIHNAETGQVTEREMDAEELKQLAADKALADAIKATEAQAEADKVAAQAKLIALGLTEADLIVMGLMSKPILNDTKEGN
jgi:hypothetical protein